MGEDPEKEISKSKGSQKGKIIVLFVLIAAATPLLYRANARWQAEKVIYVWSANAVKEHKSKKVLEDYSSVSDFVRIKGWGQFLGPRRDAVLPGVKIKRTWPSGGLKELWMQKVGPGFAGAAIFDKQVFLADRNDDQDILRCFDLESGKELYSVAENAPGRTSYNGSRCVPLVTADLVFTTSPLGNLYAISRSKRKIVWQTNLIGAYGGDRLGFGVSHSVLHYKGTVIAAAQGKDVGLVGFDAKTGKELWESANVGGGSYVSPTLAKIVGEDHLIFLSWEGLVALDPSTGKELWRYQGYRCGTSIPAPTFLSDDRIFVTGGYDAGSVMVALSKKDQGYEVSELFRIKIRGSQIQPALLYKKHLYINCNQNSNLPRRPDGLVCIDLKGQLKWQTKKAPHIDRGNIILLGDSILTLGGEDGVLRLVNPNPESYQELASMPVFTKLKRKNNQIWAPMAFADGKLVVRSQGEMKCLDLSP
jgi:outer membrane protein assembly factor BamB